MGIILGERTYTGQSMEFTALFIAINSTKLCDTQRQVLIRTGFPCEDFTVVRTVHGFQHIFLALLWCRDRSERVLSIVGIVARCHIEALSTDMWCDNFLIAVTLLHLTQVLLQTQTEIRSLR